MRRRKDCNSRLINPCNQHGPVPQCTRAEANNHFGAGRSCLQTPVGRVLLLARKLVSEFSYLCWSQDDDGWLRRRKDCTSGLGKHLDDSSGNVEPFDLNNGHE